MIRSARVMLLILIIASFQNGLVWAEVTLPKVIGSHMVLQRDQAVPIWGWATVGENVTVRFAGKTLRAKAGQTGRWEVALPKLVASSQSRSMQIKGDRGSEIELTDILVGDVWFCTGPSNIFWPVSKCDQPKKEIREANFPNIRFFTVEKNTADEPQKDCLGSWFGCSPKTVGNVSGIGYFFARRLHTEVNVPIGLLQSFWGGSRVESWTSREALKAQPALQPIFQWWEQANADYNAEQENANYQKKLKRWQQLAAVAKRDGKKPPARPKKPDDPRTSRHRPASLYNAMVAPLIPYGIKGVISYQGLGNLYWAQHSRVLLAAMIQDWRTQWNQGDFPFGMVQPAPYPCDKWPMQHPDAYALQRESQILVLDELPNTGVALTMDIGDVNELHFTNKQDVARRLAQWALATEYQIDVPYAGPIYKSMTVEYNKIRIRFKHTVNGLSTSDGLAPTDFTIAGSDNTFYPAIATIDGSTVLVHSNKVPKPVAVRFAWSDVAVPNLINSDKLPASLFRTDVPPLQGKPSIRAK